MKRSPGTEHLEAEVRSYPGSRTVSATDKYVHVGRIYPKTWMTRRAAVGRMHPRTKLSNVWTLLSVILSCLPFVCI